MVVRSGFRNEKLTFPQARFFFFSATQGASERKPSPVGVQIKRPARIFCNARIEVAGSSSNPFHSASA